MAKEKSLIVNYFDTSELKSFTDDENVAWFQGNHACNILGYANPSIIIPSNVEPEDRQKIDIGGMQEVWFINECGLYDLILGCRKKVARQFHRWLSHSVLPAIRRDGGYISQSATPEQLLFLQSKIEQQQDLILQMGQALGDANQKVKDYANDTIEKEIGDDPKAHVLWLKKENQRQQEEVDKLKTSLIQFEKIADREAKKEEKKKIASKKAIAELDAFLKKQS